MQTIVSAAAAVMSRVPSFSVGAVLDQFRAALLARDIIPPDPIVADGRLHRCHAAGRNGRGDAAYLLHLDGLPAGGFENHRDGRDWETWRFDLGRTLTAAERETFARVTQAARCVFRPIVTGRSGIVTADSGIVTGRSGDVTEGCLEGFEGCV